MCIRLHAVRVAAPCYVHAYHCILDVPSEKTGEDHATRYVRENGCVCEGEEKGGTRKGGVYSKGMVRSGMKTEVGLQAQAGMTAEARTNSKWP